MTFAIVYYTLSLISEAWNLFVMALDKRQWWARKSLPQKIPTYPPTFPGEQR